MKALSKPTNTAVWVLTASILASSMAFIDGSALNVAIPALQKSFSASGESVLWVLNAYFLMLSAFILPAGALGDKIGRKKVFMAGIAIFLLASLACGIAWSIPVLIAARIFQGLGGALMIPGSLSLINATVPDEERGKAIGTWSATTTLVTLCGPVLGGLLADIGLWRGVFLLNLPLGCIALYILATQVPESKNGNEPDSNESSGIDYLGATLLALGLGSLSYGILEVPAFGFQHPLPAGCMLSGIVLLGLFWLHQGRDKNPMMPLTLFRSPDFTGSNLLTLFLYGALSAGMFFLSLNLVQAQGYSQTLAGVATLPFALLLALLSRKMGSLADRFGARKFLIAGPALVAAGFFLLSLPGQTHGFSDYWLTFFPGILVFGVGMALTVAPLTTTVLVSAGKNHSGTASGVNNAVSRLAAVLAIAVLGAVSLTTFQQTLRQKIEPFHLSDSMKAELIQNSRNLGDTKPPINLPVKEQEKIRALIRSSFIETYKLVMLVSAAMCGLGSLMAVFLIQSKKAMKN